MAQWLLKTEPSTFSIDDLEKKSVEHWDGVRNFQARNNLRAMHVGEEAFFYHSSTEEKGIAGLCNVVREAYPDDSQFDPNSKYFDKYIDEVWDMYAREKKTPSGKWVGKVVNRALTFTPVAGGKAMSCHLPGSTLKRSRPSRIGMSAPRSRLCVGAPVT